ncbi:MAG: glycosyltransferase, partial [Thermoanaerobaculia bacterium]|nr:glycosyltransferase [Thermoanaerobaculia bacterium]
MDSVCRQDYLALEHIVVDGGSSDGTQKLVLQSGSRARLVSAINKGLRLANGDIVGVLNSDDFYSHDRVISRVVALMNQQNADVAYGDLCYVSAADPRRVVRYWRSGEYRRDKFLYGWMPPHPTFFVRKKVYEQLGGFDLALHIAADYELMLRFLFR